MLEILVYLVSGIVISLFSSMAGIGGGVFMVPLFYFLGLNINEAVATSKFVVTFISFTASMNYLKSHKVPIKQGFFILLGMVPASFMGAYLSSALYSSLLKLFVAFFILYYSIRLIHSYILSRNGSIKENMLDNNSMIMSAMKSVIVGLFSGFIAGLTGTGGGAINMPLFIGWLNLSIHTAVALSSLTIFPSALVAAIQHLSTGNVVLRIAAPYAAGSIIGASIGSRISSNLPTQKLKLYVSIILMIAGIRMLLSSLNLL